MKKGNKTVDNIDRIQTIIGNSYNNSKPLTLKEASEIAKLLREMKNPSAHSESDISTESVEGFKTIQEASTPSTKKPVDGFYGNFNIPGLGKDAKTITEDNGGSQSQTPYSGECFPPLAFAFTSKVLGEGKAKYGRYNWVKLRDASGHLGRAVMHIMAYLAGDTSEGEPYVHLGHAMCRLSFGLDIILQDLQKQETEQLKEVNTTESKWHINDAVQINVGDFKGYNGVVTKVTATTKNTYKYLVKFSDKQYEYYQDELVNGTF